MKTLIVYATKYGTTEKVANILKEKLIGTVDVINVNQSKNIDINDYNNIIIGGSIYMGKIQKNISVFIKNNYNRLLNKKLALFICAGNNEDYSKELADAFPKELLDKAILKDSMGYEYIFEKLNFLYKIIIKKIAGVNKTVSNINYNNIDKLVKLINK